MMVVATPTCPAREERPLALPVRLAGLLSVASTPNSRHRAESPRCPAEVSTLTLALSASPESWRSCFTRVNPCIWGILASVIITANGTPVCFRHCKAAAPLSAGVGARCTRIFIRAPLSGCHTHAAANQLQGSNSWPERGGKPKAHLVLQECRGAGTEAPVLSCHGGEGRSLIHPRAAAGNGNRLCLLFSLFKRGRPTLHHASNPGYGPSLNGKALPFGRGRRNDQRANHRNNTQGAEPASVFGTAQGSQRRCHAHPHHHRGASTRATRHGNQDVPGFQTPQRTLLPALPHLCPARQNGID